MERNKIHFLAAIFTLLFSSTAFAIAVPNTSSNPKTFLGPSLALSLTKGVSENTAFSIGGEGGPRIIRLDGTIGWEWTYYQRIKATAEYLQEKLTYSFFDGRASEWMHQGALGLDYQYDFHESVPYGTKLDLGAYVSHAPSRNLRTSAGSFIDKMGVLQSYTFERRIAGSNAAGVAPGVTITPKPGTDIGFLVNYDSVRYDTINRSSADAKGFGGTVFLNQALSDNVNLGLSAAVRAPYNDYEGNISWSDVPYCGTWIFKVYGAYTIGKNTLPTTYNVGFGADYLMDVVRVPVNPAPPPPMPRFKDQPVYKDQPRVYKDMLVVPPAEWEYVDTTNKSLVRWTAVPAVHMPTVLTVTDGKLKLKACVPPSFSGALDIDTGLPFSLPLSIFFGGSDLTFSVDYGGQVNNGSLFISNGNLVGNGPADPNCDILAHVQHRIIPIFITMLSP